MKALNRSHGRGITGQIRVAQVEIGRFVNTQTPYLFGAVSVDSNATRYSNANHPSTVARIMRYMTSGATILAAGSCRGSFAALNNRELAVINN